MAFSEVASRRTFFRIVKGDPTLLVDLDSELSLRTRINSNDPKTQYPWCYGTNGKGANCIQPPQRPSHVTPWACERDITPTNIPRTTDPGFRTVTGIRR